ncbi:MAG TPA: HPr family phosphocarrier protein [Candidatus Blautia faecavium]|uniref:HPr family phosphocarrier protein n=1 Tax=Candidatus Blautia faecavium TaxID=2838487 RepID=A0A9D2RWT4_9FIRM|nr:HPr family phosphocarrier protein [Candidatus Blautia faecavium]
MKEFTYTIKDEIGIHARPAGLLVKTAKKFQSKVTIQKGEKSADASKLMALMGLAVKCGDEVKFTIDGPDEEAAAAELEQFMKENL